MTTEPYNPPALVATLGGAPQVITRTLDILLKRDATLNKVVVVHTSGMRFRNAFCANFAELQIYLEATYANIEFVYAPIQDKEGQTVKDIRSATDAEFTFATLFNVMRQLKKEGRQIHGLIAGGRKSMILYTMVASQLLSEADDHLWHLISNSAYGDPHLEDDHEGSDDYLLDVPVFHLATAMPMMHALIVDSDDPIRAMRLYEQTITPARYRKLQAFYQACDEFEKELLRLAYQEYTVKEMDKQLKDTKFATSTSGINRQFKKMIDQFYKPQYGGIFPVQSRPKNMRNRLIKDLSPLLRALLDEQA